MAECFYCEKDNEKRKALMLDVCELPYSIVYLFRDQKNKGRCVVAFKGHKTEYFQLTPEENAGYFADVAKVAKVLDELYHPDKINYATYGDGMPHVHVHIVPKYKGGVSWGQPFSDSLPKVLLTDAECDAIVHVVRCFDDDNIIHVVEDVSKAEAVDPISDIDAIDYELILSDLEVVQNRAGRMAKAAKSGNNKGAAAEAAWLQQLADHLSAGKPARSFDFDEGDAEQQAVLHEMGLLSAKPVLYACNVGEDDLMEGIENNKYVPLVAARAKEEGARYIPICAKTEEDIADYSPEEKKEFLAEMGIEASGLDNLITASYDLLGLISFLTDGKKECRAWTIRKGTKAPQAAGKIHSDFERGFIRASVIGYKDLEANNFDYAAVKAKGLQRTEGKEYVVNDGDVIEFLFNV